LKPLRAECIASKSSLARERGILIEPRDALHEVLHPGSRPRPTPRERGDIAGGERSGQGSRRRDTARPQFGQDRRLAGGASVSSVGLGLVTFGAGLDHLASTPGGRHCDACWRLGRRNRPIPCRRARAAESGGCSFHPAEFSGRKIVET
jgi:hypothetical protein